MIAITQRSDRIDSRARVRARARARPRARYRTNGSNRSILSRRERFVSLRAEIIFPTPFAIVHPTPSLTMRGRRTDNGVSGTEIARLGNRDLNGAIFHTRVLFA